MIHLVICQLVSHCRIFIIGFVVEFGEDIVNGVTNETVEQAIGAFREDANLMMEVKLIADFDAFAAEAEDNPASCGSLCSPLNTSITSILSHDR